MIPLGLILLTPRTIRIVPLLGAPRTAVERTLGLGRRIIDQGDPNGGVSKVDGIPQEVVGYGAITVTYLAGRAQCVQRDFGKVPGLSWRAALAASGLSPQGVVTTPNGGTLNLSGGAIPASFFVSYTGGKATIPERTLVVRAPMSIAFSPDPAERKAILDALRPTFTKAFRGQRVEFVVESIAAKDGWAFAEVVPQSPSGRPLDFRRSDYTELKRDGMVGTLSAALLHRVNGRWQRATVALFPTDVAWEPWAEQYGAPKAIFPDYGAK